jgi:hypothetical protein
MKLSKLKISTWIFVFASLATALKPTIAAAQNRENTPQTSYVSGELLVQFIDDSATERFKAYLKTALPEAYLKPIAAPIHIYTLHFEEEKMASSALLKTLSLRPEIRHVGLNPQSRVRTDPNDSLYSAQWHLKKIGLPAVWETTTGGKTACGDTLVVAIIDELFDLKQPDLEANIWRNKAEIPNNNRDDDQNGYIDDVQGINTLTDSGRHFAPYSREATNAFSDQNHGTFCAGFVGTVSNNNKGIASPNWQVKILPISGISSAADFIQAYQYMIDLRKKYNNTQGREGAYIAVSSTSSGFDNGFPAAYPLLCQMFDRMGEQGILSVVAARNRGGDIEKSGDIPSLCTSESLVVVSRTDKNDNFPTGDIAFSAKHIDVSAPGVDVLGTQAGNNYASDSGNSFAAPLVAGVAALLLSTPDAELCSLAVKQPLAAVQILKKALLIGSDILPQLRGKTLTGGRLNAEKSFKILGRAMALGEEKILKIQPNPVLNSGGEINVYLQLPAITRARIAVRNTLGQEVFYKELTTSDLKQEYFPMRISNWSAGAYFFSILTDDKVAATGKLVVIQQ